MTARLVSSDQGLTVPTGTGQRGRRPKLSHRTAALPLTWSSLLLDGSDGPAHRFRSPSDPAVPDQPFTEGRWEEVYTRSQGVGIEAGIPARVSHGERSEIAGGMQGKAGKQVGIDASLAAKSDIPATKRTRRNAICADSPDVISHTN